MLRWMLMPERCRKAVRALQAYLDGEADPPTAAAVSGHLKACRRCGLEADTYEAIKQMLASAPSRSDADAAVLDRLHRFASDLVEDRPDCH